MALRLYNYLNRKKEIFKPIKDKKVGLYSCGPTVYWYQHIGNLRAYIFADILKKTLKWNGYKVKHVMNITDVGHLTSDADTGEDKIEKAAKKEKKTAKEISNYYWGLFRKDFEKLNIDEPDIWTKATEYIKEQIKLIKKLEKKGYTYATKDGIYFDTSKVKDYGKLAKLDIKGLEEGKRVKTKEKKNKTDFALWKFSEKPGTRQQEWESPWGIGFPGWHLECSAMSMKHLGETFDIHTGGIDHIPVHHTNEIAQSEAATGKKFVNYWMESEHLVVNDRKMSKSLKNLYVVDDLIKKGFSPLAYRYFVLNAHYRSRLNFTWEGLRAAEEALKNLQEATSKISLNLLPRSSEKEKEYEKKFENVINDDLNTPQALGVLWAVLRDQKLPQSSKTAMALKFDKILSLGLKIAPKIPSEIKEMALEREEFRKKGEWSKSDKIRSKIEKKGWHIDDTTHGPTLINKV